MGKEGGLPPDPKQGDKPSSGGSSALPPHSRLKVSWPSVAVLCLSTISRAINGDDWFVPRCLRLVQKGPPVSQRL